MLVYPPSVFGRSYQQTARGGVTLTSGAAHTMGSYATLIDPVSFAVYGVLISVWGIAVSAAAQPALMDIAIAPTGGGNEQIVIPFLDVGSAEAATGEGSVTYFFPLYIPPGKALRARFQSITASDVCQVVAHVFSHPPHGFSMAPQQYNQYGANAAASRGAAVTSGSGSFGTEVDVTAGAGTTRDHKLFSVGIDYGTNTGITAGRYRVRLARDTGAANIIGIWEFDCSSGEDNAGPFPGFPVCCHVPSGSLLYIDIEGAASEAMSAMVYAA